MPRVYAVGDVPSVGTLKAGVFAEGQAAVVAAAIANRVRGQGDDARYDGHGRCYLEFGSGNMGVVDVTFAPGSPPVGHLLGPDASYVADKIEFGNSRVRRWFGHEWDG